MSEASAGSAAPPGSGTIDAVAGLRWAEHPGNPLIRPPFPSPILADPTYLPGAEAPDGRHHLFAHSILGIHHFVSPEGITWRRLPGVVCRNALRPFLLRDGGGFVLCYERTRLFLPFGVPWSSWIEARTSEDLLRWGPPRRLLAPSLPWHTRPPRDRAVGNPCLVRAGEGWRLYYSAGLVRLPDCGFDEPRHVGVADGPTPLGPFAPRPEPLLSPSDADPLANLGAGSLKVLRLADGWLGLQNGIYRDAEGRSRSAIRLHRSEDGLRFAPLPRPPLVAPGEGWKASFVYACDLRRVGPEWRLYFNARRGWHWSRGREAIGLAIGT